MAKILCSKTFIQKRKQTVKLQTFVISYVLFKNIWKDNVYENMY